MIWSSLCLSFPLTLLKVAGVRAGRRRTVLSSGAFLVLREMAPEQELLLVHLPFPVAFTFLVFGQHRGDGSAFSAGLQHASDRFHLVLVDLLRDPLSTDDQ